MEEQHSGRYYLGLGKEGMRGNYKEKTKMKNEEKKYCG